MLERRERGDFVNAAGIAEVYAGLGDRERMFEWLERAYEDRDEGLLLVVLDPKFESFRDDRRFQDLVRRVQLGAGGR